MDNKERILIGFVNMIILYQMRLAENFNFKIYIYNNVKAYWTGGVRLGGGSRDS